MKVAKSNFALTQPIRSMAFPEGQLALLFLLLGIGGALILATMQRAAFNTALLFVFVAVYGLMRCRITQTNIGDQKLEILGYFWLIKLGFTIFLLYVSWIPQLDPASSSTWGYDPQRYYIQAQELIENNWQPEFLSLNYMGILYYYAAIYYILGHNPVIPALINAFVTLIATLYLVKAGYEIKGQRGTYDWTLAYALLLPELLWYDVMTSRETLLAAALLFALLTTGRYFARTAPISLFKVLIVIGLSAVTIGAVRTSVMLPMCTAMALMALLVRHQQHSLRVVRRLVLTGATAAALIVAQIITGYLGGDEFELSKAIQVATSAQENIALHIDVVWSEQSIGMLLMPEGLIQSILFLPPRMILYLAAPLPNVYVQVSALLAGSWFDWQKLFTLLSSFINLLAMPLVLASLVQSIKTRDINVAPLMLHVSYWILFMAIAGGNLIIHERYRVMASLLLWGCAWLGWTTCSKSLITKTSLLWSGLLALSALFYLVYKFGIA